MTEGWQRGSQSRRESARAGARRPEGNVSRPFVPVWEECTWAGSIVTERDELMGRMSFSSRFPQYLITAMLDEQLAVATDTPPGTWSMPPVDAITSDHMMPRFRPLNRLCMPYLGISCALKVREARLMRSACVVSSPRPSSSTFLPRFSGCDPGPFVVKLCLVEVEFFKIFHQQERRESTRVWRRSRGLRRGIRLLCIISIHSPLHPAGVFPQLPRDCPVLPSTVGTA